MDIPPNHHYEARLGALIREAMRTQGISENELSARTLIPRVTLRRWLGGHGFKVTGLFVIADNLGLDVEDMVRQVVREAA